MTQPSIEKGTAGFQQPQEPQDDWTARLYQEYELGPTPSLEEIEPIATKLLSDIRTALAGAELVLGRRVDRNVEKEPDVLPLLTTPGSSGTKRFGLLLLRKWVENEQAAARTAATTV